ncbi:MAG: hypothetical protein GX595_18720, partial [Lentisphaerae bacterium]|nr:hypothetical protein [Lentisphaerota bacterium]
MSRIDGATSRFGQRLRRGLLMLLALGSAGWLSAADGDADGLPDDVETALGTDPAVGEVFTTLLERAVPARVQDKARGITAVAMANAGGNRFVWRLTFAADYPKTNSNLVFYLDADNNPATGRQGHGCEAMLIINDGAGSTNGFNPDGSSRPAEAPRAAVVGPHLYISADIDLLQQDGQSVLRFMALSETWTPHQGVDNVPYTIAKGPAVSTRPKVKLDSDITVSVGVLRTFGPRTIDPIVADPSNHRLRVFDCTLEGFRFVPSEYRADNVIRTGLPARIVGTAPAAGSFHVGVVMHDAAGREVMALAVNDRRVGVAVADWDDNNQHLFVTAEPVAVQAGDRIELRALNSDGLCRVEDLVLLRQPPAARQAPCQILHLAATADRLTWITTWPAACTVELADGRTITESEPWNNHRVAIPGLQPGQAVRCRVTATARDGSAVHSDWLDYTWQAPAEPPTTTAGKVRLQVTPPAGVALRDWPVTGGVPFPRGVLGSTASLHLRDAAGALQPLQASVSSRWQDGSVKWALIDFRHSGPAATYDLAYGPTPAPAGSRPAAPSATPATTLGRLQLTDAAGKDFTAEVQAGTLETNGALRLEHAGSGSLVNPDGSRCFAYEASLQRYPGTPWTRALLTIVNDADAAEFTTVESLRWELPATAPAAAFVRQHRDDQYQSSSGDGRRWSGPLGAVMVRDFWQNYPLDLEVGPQGSAVWLWPRLRQDEVDWANGTVDEHRLFYWFEPIPARQAGGYKLRQGMTKTYEVWLGADGATPPYDRPLMPVCTPQWYADSMVFGEL